MKKNRANKRRIDLVPYIQNGVYVEDLKRKVIERIKKIGAP